MKSWRTKYLCLAGAASLLAAIPAFGQQDDPESLLPPGFGEPDAPLPPRDDPPPPRDDDPPPAPPPPVRDAPTVISNSATEDLEELGPLVEPPEPIEIPEASRRSTEFVGPLGPDNWGLGQDAFGSANGRLLGTLMRRLDAPLPSRWASILLRRALLSQVPAPSHVAPVDWVAERAWLLLRMGEADAARMLVQAVDVDQFTPRMFTVAVQSALATADPAALCPLVEQGRTTSDEAVWPLADAMCAALEGESGRASALIDQARRRSGAGGIDLLLAEKVVGAGTDTRRAVTIQWDGVTEINAWRFGLASATGLAIPDALMNGAGAHVRAWQARAPMVPLEQRVAAAQTAASLGIFSSSSLIDMYSLLADGTDPSDMAGSVGDRLRRAYAARRPEARITALRSLWDEGKTPEGRHARLILTASAASLIPPAEAYLKDAANLIGSMLSAGLDRQAARWSTLVDAGDDSGAAWALLALGSARPRVDISSGRVSAFADGDSSPGKRRARMLVAALAGLDRLAEGEAEDLAEEVGINLAATNRWSRMLAAAARGGQPGTVALLAAVGLQTPSWEGVPPEHVFHILTALRQAGLEYEARMIAAEALTRL